MTFLSEGLGPARDNFSTNLARLKNLRQWTALMHDQQAAMHKETKEMIDAQMRAARPPFGPQGGDDLGWWMAVEEERLSEEPRTTREMMLTYLITTLDVFFGQWREENNIGSGWWPSADPDRIEEAFQDIATARQDPALMLLFQPRSRDRLVEIRARRDVMVHRGGKADQRYCDKTQDQTVLGQRLPVDDDYLDQAVEFVDDLVATIATCVRSGPQSAAAAAARPPLIAKIFV